MQHCCVLRGRGGRKRAVTIAKIRQSRKLRAARRSPRKNFSQWHGVRLRGDSVVAKKKKFATTSWPAGPLTNVSERLPCPWLLSQLKRFRRVRGPGFFASGAIQQGVKLNRPDVCIIVTASLIVIFSPQLFPYV
jgi:hypothetical protein